MQNNHLQAYVITVAIIRTGGKYLIARRALSKKFSPGQWELISGFVDTAESAEEIILREIKEELGAKGEIFDALPPFSFRDVEGRWIIVPFLVQLENQEVKINTADHLEARWVAASELKNYRDLNPFLENESIKSILINE